MNSSVCSTFTQTAPRMPPKKTVAMTDQRDDQTADGIGNLSIRERVKNRSRHQC